MNMVDVSRGFPVETRTRRVLPILRVNPLDAVMKTKAEQPLGTLLDVAEAAFGAVPPAPPANPPSAGHANDYPGGAVDFVRPGDFVITAEQATLITRNCVHPIQDKVRPLNHPAAKEHIDTLSAIMSTGLAWMEETQIRFGVLDGRLWLMDGNHRIRAQANAAVSIPWNVKVDRYDSEDTFRAAFHKFNTNTRGRTEPQILGAAGFSSDYGISKQTAAALYRAVPFIVLGFRTSHRDRTEHEVLKSRIVDIRMDIASKYIGAALDLDECLKKGDGKIKRKILVAGITAVALVTLGCRATSAAAKEFWSGLARNDGLKKGDPRRTLAIYLLSEPLTNGASAAAAAAWNAWFERRQLSVIRTGDVDAVRIAGTIFKGE